LKNLEFKCPFNIIFIIIPILVTVIFILGYRKKDKIMNLLKIGGKTNFKLIRTILTALGVGLMFFSLLGPQIFKGVTEVNRKGLDIYVLIDTSKSMLAEDIKPNRISRATKIIEDIVDNLHGDRIGFIPFSSSAYIQMPLTDDYKMAKMFLKVIDTDMIGGGGSNVGNAIKLADKSFDETSSSDKVVIILSDGEEHESDSLDILKNINDEHMKVFTIGIGTEKGGLIPVYDAAGEKKIGYKKDQSEQAIMSKLNSDTLKKLASNGNGTYYQSSVIGNEIDSLINDISSLKRDMSKTEKIKRYKQIYQYFLGVGILLFLIAYLIPERRNLK
jgi:Ca-activated chloride channel homolog